MTAPLGSAALLTVSALARQAGISRSTVLYYESIGLLRPARRNAKRYRFYDASSTERLSEIRRYRALGVPMHDVALLLGRPGAAAADVLARRLAQIEEQIAALRVHELAIRKLLAGSTGWKKGPMTKDKWVEIMKAAGFSRGDMHRWHRQFEQSAPEEHQQFLRYLKVPEDEIASIRAASRA